MAQYSLEMQVIKRSLGRSAVAAAAYRSGERLVDERTGNVHDYRRRRGVEHREILLPVDAPDWVKGIDRQTLWSKVEMTERAWNSQVARDLRVMIPREVPPEERVRLLRDFVNGTFVAKGMVADVCWHNKTASDGGEQPHAHVMLTMRPLTENGFGLKSRHDRVPDPQGRTHPDGRPVMVDSNPDSWNSVKFLLQCRGDWETIANEALERAGSDQRIDKRSLLERGLARMPEPALRLAHYLKDLRGCMRERFGQFQMAKHYQAIEKRAKAAFRTAEHAEGAPAHLAAASPKRTVRDAVTPQPGGASRLSARYFGWFDRMIDRLSPAAQPQHAHPNERSVGGIEAGGAPRRSPPTQETGYDR